MKNPLRNILNNPMNEPSECSRRKFLMMVVVGVNGFIGVVLAVPLLGYILEPVFKRNQSYNYWVPVGNLEQFPPGETRLGQYRNPDGTAADGQTRNLPCWVRNIDNKQFQVFAINCAHMECRCTGFRNRSCSCVPATAESTTRMDLWLLGLRRGRCINTNTRLSAIS